VVVADHEAIDRGGLVGLLDGEQDIEVVGEAATIQEAVEQCESLRPDVLLLSLGIPDQKRMTAIPFIRERMPALRILAMSERGDGTCMVLNPPSREQLPQGFKTVCSLGTDCLTLAATQGAMGTLRRSADPEELFRAIRAIAQGNAWYDRTTATGMLGAATRGEMGGRFSQREVEVAAMIAEGLSNKEISTSLGISEPTVKKHVGHILEKLGLADRLQAGLFLARHPAFFR
jgi:DNA-binding NarL/FixJ family response regulator